MVGRMVMTGATGQIGRPLSERLVAAGCDLIVLSRDPQHARSVLPGALDHLAWQPGEPGPWFEAVDGADAVIGLADAPFFRKWKTTGSWRDRSGCASRACSSGWPWVTWPTRSSPTAGMVPRKALDLGYAFEFRSLEPALRDLLLP